MLNSFQGVLHGTHMSATWNQRGFYLEPKKVLPGTKKASPMGTTKEPILEECSALYREDAVIWNTLLKSKCMIKTLVACKDRMKTATTSITP
jgi:hypothetical protein